MTDTLAPHFFLLVIQMSPFLSGNKVLRWICWDRNSLSLVQRFFQFKESLKRLNERLPILDNQIISQIGAPLLQSKKTIRFVCVPAATQTQQNQA